MKRRDKSKPLKKNNYDKSPQERKNKLSEEKIRNSLMNLVLKQNELKKIELSFTQKLQQIQQKINDQPFGNAPNKDSIFLQILQLERDVKSYEIKGLVKNVGKLLGKRILAIEIHKQKTNLLEKIENKEKIEQKFFRHIRIKKFDYKSLVKQKLKEECYVAIPYSNGKGFIESSVIYDKLGPEHEEKLEKCHYLQVIKEVNKIFINNFTFGVTSVSNQTSEKIFNGSIFFTFLFTLMGIFFLSSSQMSWALYSMLGLLSMALILMIIYLYREYHNVPNGNTYYQETINEINKLFELVNKNNKNSNYRWVTNKDLMYLQVRFQRQCLHKVTDSTEKLHNPSQPELMNSPIQNDSL